MAKVKKTFQANITLNQSKGGGWLASYTLSSTDSIVSRSDTTAWKNASAAKRWIKEKVTDLTPRKSVKLIAVNSPGVEKPTGFQGELTFNA